jgi:hypothetical protein
MGAEVCSLKEDIAGVGFLSEDRDCPGAGLAPDCGGVLGALLFDHQGQVDGAHQACAGG